MPDYEQYISRHGEVGVQAMIEQIERHQGMRSSGGVPLEDRWHAVMALPVAGAVAERLAA